MSSGFRGGAGRAKTWSPSAEALMAVRWPLEQLLTLGLRRVAWRLPDIFQRLGVFQKAVFVLLPDAWPVAFELSPRARQGTVRIARATHRPPGATCIRGPLPALIGLFDCSVDADSAFFSRDIIVEGDIQAVMALHNALEAADLTLADLLCLSPPSSTLANSGMALILRRLKAFRQAASAR